MDSNQQLPTILVGDLPFCHYGIRPLLCLSIENMPPTSKFNSNYSMKKHEKNVKAVGGKISNNDCYTLVKVKRFHQKTNIPQN